MSEGITPVRGIRVSDKLWNAVKRKAAKEETTASAVVVQLLRAYVEAK